LTCINAPIIKLAEISSHVTGIRRSRRGGFS
jgi:hypothetical protein